VGTDGQAKMSKSKNNAIYLKDDAETVTRKAMGMWTPRMSPTEPGDPDVTPAFMYHRAFNQDKAEVAELEERYRKGTVGDAEVKRKLAAALNTFLDPIRERRARFEANMPLVREALECGTQRGRAIAQETMEMVRDALDLNYLEQYR
jgi:tryptophanyl-tRNA synthetase